MVNKNDQERIDRLAVRVVVEAGADVNLGKDGSITVHNFTNNGRSSTSTYPVKETPLHAALKAGVQDSKLLQLLISPDGKNLTLPGHLGQTPIELAKIRKISFILDKGAEYGIKDCKESTKP